MCKQSTPNRIGSPISSLDSSSPVESNLSVGYTNSANSEIELWEFSRSESLSQARSSILTERRRISKNIKISEIQTSSEMHEAHRNLDGNLELRVHNFSFCNF